MWVVVGGDTRTEEEPRDGVVVTGFEVFVRTGRSRTWMGPPKLRVTPAQDYLYLTNAAVELLGVVESGVSVKVELLVDRLAKRIGIRAEPSGLYTLTKGRSRAISCRDFLRDLNVAPGKYPCAPAVPGGKTIAAIVVFGEVDGREVRP